MRSKVLLVYLIFVSLLSTSLCQDDEDEAAEEKTTTKPPKTTTKEAAITDSEIPDEDLDYCIKYEPDGSTIETPYDSCIEYCCGGDVLKTDSDSECCGSESFGSKYNPSADRCCKWWTGEGKGHSKRKFIDHTQGCCGANFITHGKQGCCYGYPDPPETFVMGTQMCCGSHSVKIPTLHFLSRCCGDKEAYDITSKSCPCEDGRVLDATYDKSGCCEGRFGIRMPYYTLTEFCCDGFIGEIGVDFCCASSLGKVGEDMCCDGTLTKMSEPSKTKTACCETENYDPKVSVCCEGEILAIAGGRDQCCGARAYSLKSQICCDGRLSNRNKDGDTCCGRYAFDPDKGSFCCEGQVYFSDAVGGDACCGVNQYYNVSDGISLCCNGVLIPRDGRDSCCGDLPYFSDTEICCDDTAIFPKLSGSGCCMGYAYDDTDPKVICCDDGPGGPYEEPACCGGIAYSKRNGICCGETLYNDLTSPACCVDVGYDSSTHTCCGSTVYPNPFDSRSTQCCGMVDPQPFDIINQKCCEGLVIDLPGELSRDRAQCCGLFDIFDPESQICCDGTVYEQGEGNIECCGKESYSSKDSLCCENKEYGNPFLTNFTHGREKTGCCGDLVYDTEKEHCCDGYLQESKFTKSGCCAGIEYDAEKEICCEHNLFQLGKGIPSQKAICCGSKCMYDGVQVCCKNRIYMRGELSDKTCEHF